MDFIQLRLWLFRQAGLPAHFRSMSNTYSGIPQKVFATFPELLFDFDRNRCSICSGMSVRHGAGIRIHEFIKLEYSLTINRA